MSDLGIVVAGVSKFYGEVLGVNRIDLALAPGLTALVGPNGSGKSTLLNLMAGLLRPSRGSVTVRGVTPDDPQQFYRQLGYCTQYDAFPAAFSGRRMLTGYLRVHGFDAEQATALADKALTRVGLLDAADRSVDAYSKGMRQRLKLALAIAHEPEVLLLDEPMNGLDPIARAEAATLLREFAELGRHVVVSSHNLSELDTIADRVVVLQNGYVVAAGEVGDINAEIAGKARRLAVRSADASAIAAELFDAGYVLEARLEPSASRTAGRRNRPRNAFAYETAESVHQEDEDRLFLHVRDADAFFLAFNRLVVQHGWQITAVERIDETVEAVYRQLVGADAAAG